MACDTRADDLEDLVERGMEAGVKGRYALAATLLLRAENLASQMHDDTSLVPAWLQYYQAVALRQHATLARKTEEGTPREGAGIQEAAALCAQAWELRQGVIAVIERRTAAGTTVRRKERGVSLAFVGLAHPVAEVWHVPQRGGGFLQALSRGCTAGEQPASARHSKPRNLVASCWLRAHDHGRHLCYS